MESSFNGNLFVNRLLEVTEKKSQRELADELSDIISVSTSKISKWRNGDSLPDAADLFTIDAKYKCGIDYLLGRKEKSDLEEKKPLTFRDVARMLVEIDEGFCLGATIEDHETYFEINQFGYVDYNPSQIPFPNRYPYVRFGFTPEPIQYQALIEGTQQTTDLSPTNGYIELNKFLRDYIKLRDTKKETLEDIMDPDTWRVLIDAKLQKVSNDPAPYPFKTVPDPECMLFND